MSFRPIGDRWILGRPKVKYFGAYPAGFLLRARDMLGVGHGDQVLHVCGGRVRDYLCGPGCPGNASVTHFHGWGEYDITMDLDESLKPDLFGDAGALIDYRRAIEAHPQIQAVLADPPYTVEFAANYQPGAERFPTVDAIVRNAIEILPIGGRVGVLSLQWPRYPKNKARQIYVGAVYVGNGNLGRTFAVFERTA